MMLNRVAACICLTLGAVAMPALAQEPFGPPFQVNTGSAGWYSQADVGIDAAGTFVVVWAGTEGGAYQVFGRRYDVTGAPMGPPFPISDAAGRDPKVASSDSGEFLVVWSDPFAGGAPVAIRARRYDASGAPGPEFRVNAATGVGRIPAIAAGPGGGFVVVWADHTAQTVFARGIDGSGVPTGAEFLVNATTTTGWFGPSVGVDAAGNFVIAWHGSSGRGFFGRFDAAGAPLSGDVSLEGFFTAREVAVAPDGSFMVAAGDYTRVFTQAFDAAGAALGPPFVVSNNFDAYYTYAISTAADPSGSGNFVVAWQAAHLDDEYSEDFRITGLMLDRTGRRIGNEFTASSVQSWPPYTEPSVALNAEGHLVTVWSDPVTRHVFARHYGASRLSGTVTDARTGLPLAGASLAVSGLPRATSDAQGRYALVLAPGTYPLGVSLQNYVTATASADIQFGSPAVRDFALAGSPVLQTADATIDDSGPGGNGNGVVDPNERFLLRLAVRNAGPGAATGVSATVTSPTSGVTVLQSSTPYLDIAPGAVLTGQVAFELVTPLTHPLGAPLLADLAVATDQGPVTLHYSIPTGQRHSVDFAVTGPIEIPDRLPTLVVPIPVSGIEGPILNVALRLHLTHPSPSDLHIELYSADRNRITVAYAIPATGPDLGTDCPAGANDTTFTDAAPISISQGTTPYIGEFRPFDALSRYKGKSGAAVNGTWELYIKDFLAFAGQASAGRFECATLVIDEYRPATGGHQEVAITGTVTDAFTGAPLAGATVSTVSGFSTVTGADGGYVLDVLPGTSDVIADASGYRSGRVSGVTASAGRTENVNLALMPVILEATATAVDDLGLGGNANGRVDVNERLRLRVTLANSGAADVTAVSAALSTAMPGVIVAQGQSAYPDIPTGGAAANVIDFVLQTAPDFAAGQTLELLLAVSTAQGAVTVPVGLETGTVLDTPVVFSATGPLPIPKYTQGPPATLTFNVSGLTSPVAKVVAQVHAKNPEARRVSLHLEGPDATNRILFGATPGFPGLGADFGQDCPADANDTTFDDEATLYIGAGGPPRVGSFRPWQPLAAFRGKEPRGVWKLTATHSDTGNLPYGTLECGRLLVYGSVSADAVPLSDRIFWDGFETGELSAWSGVSNASGDLRVSTAAALADSSRGLEAVVNDTEPLYVRDDTPASEPRYRARFHFDPNGFDPGEAAGRFRAIVFMALDESPQKRVVQLILRRLGGAYSLRARITLDDGTRAETPFVPITDAPHVVEFDWMQATAPGAGDGSFQLWIDGVPAPALTGLRNHAYAVDYTRLGAMVLKPGASGTMYFDRFESRRENYIGP